jgi:Tetratricopeptide repeat.
MEMVGAFATAFEMGIRLAALVLVVALVGAAIIGRIMEGELTGSHATIALLFVAALLVGVVLLWNSPFVFALFLVAAGLAALWWLAQVTAEHQLVHQIHAEDEARYKAALERDPNNAAAWSALGELYLEAKRYDDAIACYERAVQIMPTATEEKRKLRRAQQLKEEAQRTQRHCPQCRSPLPLLAVTCPQCGEEVSAPVWVYLLAAARDREALRRTFLAFLVAFPIVTLWLMLFFALNFLGRALLLLFTLVAILIVVMMELRG